MRTKALFLAALTAAGLTSSQAQVYSVNVAGYVTVQMTNGLNMVANPLNRTGSNNTVNLVLSNSLPLGSIVYKFQNGGFVPVTYAVSGKGTGATTNWGVAGTNTLNPGEGFFAKLPLTNNINITNFTFVGDVMQGALSNKYIPTAGGLTFLSSQVPQGGGVQNVLGFIPTLGDTVYTWNPSGNGGGGAYVTAIYTKTGKGTSATTNWSPAEPVLSVAQGFILKTTNSGVKWQRNFTVQ